MPSAGMPLRPSFVRSIQARIARPRPFTQRRTANETSPSSISASGSGRCRAAGCVSFCKGASLSTRPVRIIAGFPPGGFTDTTARLIGQWLSERLGQQFFIENRPGAGTNIATEAVVRSPRDGYTLLVVNDANAYSATLYDNLKFNSSMILRRSRALGASHDCIMVRSLWTYRIQGCGAMIRAQWQAPLCSSSRPHQASPRAR